MNSFNTNFLVYWVIALLAVLLVVSIIKKALKLVIFIIAIMVALSAYNILVKGVSPIEEISGYKTNALYAKSVTELSVKIKASVESIKNSMQSKNVDANTINVIKAENEKLHKYQEEALKLQHTKKLNSFHEKYCGYLKTIIDAVDGTEKLAKSAQGKNIDVLQAWMEKINAGLSNLVNLK